MLLGNFRRRGEHLLRPRPGAVKEAATAAKDLTLGGWRSRRHIQTCVSRRGQDGARCGERRRRGRGGGQGAGGSGGGEGVRGSTWWERSCCSQPGRAAGRASGLRNAQQTPPERPSVLGGPGSAAGRCAALWRAVPPTLWRDSGQEEKAGWGEGGALCVTSSEKTDLDVPASFSQPTGKGVGS